MNEQTRADLEDLLAEQDNGWCAYNSGGMWNRMAPLRIPVVRRVYDWSVADPQPVRLHISIPICRSALDFAVLDEYSA